MESADQAKLSDWFKAKFDQEQKQKDLSFVGVSNLAKKKNQNEQEILESAQITIKCKSELSKEEVLDLLKGKIQR